MSRPGANAGFLSDQQVDIIATRLAERFSALPTAKTSTATARSVPANAPHAAPRNVLGEGIFATVDDAVEAAGVAFRELDGMSLT